ncbi:carbohydrate ABC transporter permease, partial [Mesorhizobium sp. M4B.F.Ca.ET.211.01.1.1]
MAEIAASVPAQANALRRDAAGPSGTKPRHVLSRRNIFLYGTLIMVALYYLLPLYVMVVTSLKG